MAYFPVDDDMAFHPKILAAGNEAIGMWVRAGALAKKHFTGGFVTESTARALGTKRLADRLVSSGLWVESSDPELGFGYRFHDWKQQAGNDDAEVEKERAEKSRERNAARQKEWRDRNRESNGVTNAPVTGGPSPSPSPSPKTDPTGLIEVGPVPAVREMTDQEVSISEETRLAALDAGIRDITEVVQRLRTLTGDPVTAEAAFDYAQMVLGRAKKEPRHPGKYVLSAIEQSPVEARNYLDWSGLTA